MAESVEGANRQAQQGRMAFSIAGTMIGSALGSPWVGNFVGTAIGIMLFPTKYQKPDKYTELGVNSALEGIPIPVVYGTAKIAGNYIWKGSLEASSIKEKTGGSGGKKVVVGYDYFMDGAMGVCRGPNVALGRIFKNNELFMYEGTNTFTFYSGASDQTIDPVISSEIGDNASPFRGLSYMVFDRWPIGANNATAPTIAAEVSRYPYNSNAGDQPRIYTKYSSIIESDATTSAGISVKGSDGKIYSVSETALRVWDKELTAYEREIALDYMLDPGSETGLADYSSVGVYDVDIFESENKRYILVLHFGNSGGFYDIWVSSIETTKTYSYKTFSGDRKQYVNTETANSVKIVDNVAGSYQFGGICHNSDYSWVILNSSGATNELYRFALNSFTSPTITDLSSDITDNVASVSIDATDDYLFIANTAKLYSFNASTLALADSLAHNGSGWSVCALPESDEVLLVRTTGGSPGPPALGVYSYNTSTGGSLALRKEISLLELWDTAPASYGYEHIEYGIDGTLLISYRSGYDGTEHGVQHIIMDCNPAQILYDIMVNHMEIDSGDIDTTALQDLSDYCADNYIGLSGVINTQQEAVDVLRNIFTYVHGIMFLDNTGRWSFKVFRNTDASEATITDEDIIEGEFEKIEVIIKDKRRMPNRIDVHFQDRLNKHRDSGFSVDHFLAQEEDGEIISERVDLQWISNSFVASRQAYRLLKYAQYDAVVFNFTLMPKYLYLNIGDVLTLNISSESISSQKVRILSIDEPPLDVGGGVTIMARKEETYLNTFEEMTIQQYEGEDTSPNPPSPVRPIIFELPSLWTNDQYALGITAIRNDTDVLTAKIMWSEDGTSYQEIGEIGDFAIVGDVDQSISETEEANIYLDYEAYPDAFSSYTIDEQRADQSFSLIGLQVDGDCALTNQEFVTFRGASTSGNDVTLSDPYRGKYHTLPKSHTTAETLLQVGGPGYARFFRLNNFGEQNVGRTFYIKLLAVNQAGEVEAIEDVSAYTYTVQGDTKKATHAGGVQLYDGVNYLGVARTWDGNTPDLRWVETCRYGGWASRAWSSGWLWNDFTTGDVENYEIIVYNSALGFIATHDLSGVVTQYQYTKAQNITDFGTFTTNFYLGVRPLNARGGVPDIFKKEILLV